MQLNTGLFGPLPFGDDPSTVVLVYGSFVKDSDYSRLEGVNYILIVFVAQKNLVALIDKKKLIDVLLNKLDEIEGVFLVLARRDAPGPGHHHQRTGSAAWQEIVARSKTLTFFLNEPVQIVVIHKPYIHFAGTNSRDNGRILFINYGLIGYDQVQPFPCFVLAPGLPHRRHHPLGPARTA